MQLCRVEHFLSSLLGVIAIVFSQYWCQRLRSLGSVSKSKYRFSSTRHSLQYISQSTGDLVDPKSLYYGAIYEVEVWLKYTGAKGTVRRKLDLVAKCHPKKESVDQGLRNLF